jgi:hypothetical protein
MPRFVFVVFQFMGGVTAKPGGGLAPVRWAFLYSSNYLTKC